MNPVAKRQADKRQIDPSKPAMTTKDGTVVAFNTTEVYQANKDAGL